MADAAYTLGSTLATLGLNESTIRRILAERLAINNENRGRALQNVSANDSSRGMLQSSQAMRNQADTNLEYDRSNASINSEANDNIAMIAQQRLDAEAAYNKQLADAEAKKAAEQDLIKPGFDPADPFNWKGIAAAQAAGTASPPGQIPIQPGGTADDPFNWRGIAQAQEQSRAQQAAQRTITRPRPTATKPSTSASRPRALPGQVVRF